MPFPTDEELMKTAAGLVEGFQTLFGKHPGFRPAHAKGQLVRGTFTPTAEAGKLSSAAHFNTPVKVLARFSTSTGLPHVPDTVPDTLPHGMSVRFELPNTADGRRSHTDIISHSTESFPTRTGEEFLEMLQLIVKSQSETDDPNSIKRYVMSHKAAADHLSRPKPATESYAGDRYFGVNTFRLVNGEQKTNVRYRFEPEDGVRTLSDEEFKAKSVNYLSDELRTRLSGRPIIFKLISQIAEEGDRTDDCTSLWPEDRKKVELGTLELREMLDEQTSLETQKKVIYDPIPRIEGVEPSDDPMLEMRAAVYLLSGKQRREAE